MLYFIVGLIAGAMALGLVWQVQARHMRLTWYEWLIAAAAVVLAVLAVQNFDGSLQELEPAAAWFLLAAFGFPAVVLAAVDVFLVRRNKQAVAAPKA